MKRIALGVVILLPVVMSLFLWYLGAFRTVKVQEGSWGPYHLVFLEQQGAYKQSGKTIREVVKLLREQGIEQATPFGIFYDNPDSVPEDRLRSEVGCIVQEQDTAQLTGIKGGLLSRGMPASGAAFVEFPFKNFLSIIVGVSKAYPALDAYMKEKGRRYSYAMEIYETNRILYLMPLTPGQ